MKTFHRLLVNALISTVMTSFLWFALTFWVYLETRSVLATSVIGGAFAIFSSVFGILFGTFVDHHRKWTAMMVAALITLATYGIALVQYGVVSNESLLSFSSVHFWILVALVLAGSVVGNMRAIAMSTTVTLLVPEEHRDRANGLVGTVMGVSFAITSVLSGLVVGRLGMGWALVIAVSLTAVSVLHLLTIRFDEPEPERAADGARPPAFDVRGSLAAISGVAGLYGLIFFAAFNNLLGGVFMSLMDAYGLSLMSVEAWGVLFGIVSFGMIGGGLYVSRKGLGSRPMRIILICNLVNWTVCTVFTLQSSIPLLFIGMLVWMSLMPAIEAAEQTVLQQVVPFEQQGRVFGFAQTVETAASPITALLIGPFAQLIAMPFMTDGAGVDLIGDWFGVGEERGIALIFTAAGILGVLATFAASRSRWYRHLSELTDKPGADGGGPSTEIEAEAFAG
jgi:DHA3 family multidrug efflux protein-like MFS transporter